jgi:Arc/MetJ-type ribon-helix-helix transcriptional regulator
MGPSDAVKKAEEMKNSITLPYNPVMRLEPDPNTRTAMPTKSNAAMQNINIKSPPGMDMKAPPAMAKGGLAEGGMLQEGGTVDPVSGNEVPTGSLQEEVRDDIPAQLSEGEFVFPADVVRYIGLEKLMQLRQAAKEGLAKMEAMGQMSNSEEATMDDTGEFESEIDDILKEVESEKEEDEEEEQS